METSNQRITIAYRTQSGRKAVANSSLRNGAKTLAFLITAKCDIKKVAIR